MENGTSKILNWVLLIMVVLAIVLQTRTSVEMSELKQDIIAQANAISEQQLVCPTPEVTIDAPQNNEQSIVTEDRFTQHTQEYADFITTIGPLLREYPEMIQFLMVLEISAKSQLMILPSDKFESLIPLPD